MAVAQPVAGNVLWFGVFLSGALPSVPIAVDLALATWHHVVVDWRAPDKLTVTLGDRVTPITGIASLGGGVSVRFEFGAWGYRAPRARVRIDNVVLDVGHDTSP